MEREGNDPEDRGILSCDCGMLVFLKSVLSSCKLFFQENCKSVLTFCVSSFYSLFLAYLYLSIAFVQVDKAVIPGA